MKRLTLLALLFIVQWLNRSESCDLREQEKALTEHIRELWNQVDTLEFLVA